MTPEACPGTAMTSEGRDRSVTAVTIALPRRGSSLAHRADPKGRVSDPEGRVSEKWTRFSAPNDALIKEESIGSNPKSESRFFRPML